MILNRFEGQPLPVYGDGLQVRDWIHVDDHCEAVDAILAGGVAGEIYNVGVGDGLSDAARPCDRAAHQARRLVDPPRPRSTRARPPLRPDHWQDSCGSGWRPRRAFDDGLAETVDWYRANRPWTERVRTGAYRRYYERQYSVLIAAGAQR